MHYLRDLSNYMDWAAAICSLVFVVPLLLNMKSSWHWQAGALAALASWINLLLYLQRYWTARMTVNASTEQNCLFNTSMSQHFQ